MYGVGDAPPGAADRGGARDGKGSSGNARSDGADLKDLAFLAVSDVPLGSSHRTIGMYEEQRLRCTCQRALANCNVTLFLGEAFSVPGDAAPAALATAPRTRATSRTAA